MKRVKKVEDILDFTWCLQRISTQTPYGLDYKKAIKPYPRGAEKYLEKALDQVEAYMNYLSSLESTMRLADILHCAKDIRFSIQRSVEENVLSEVELFEIKAFIFLLDDLKAYLESSHAPYFEETDIQTIPELTQLLNPEGSSRDTFYIYDSYSEELARIRDEISTVNRDVRTAIRNYRKKIQDDYQISLNPDQSIIVSKSNEELKNRVENCPYLTFASESYSNLVYTLKKEDALYQQEAKIDQLKEAEEREEFNIRQEITAKIASYNKEITTNIHHLANLDLTLAKAKFSLEIKGVKPKILQEHRIELCEGRHPKIEHNLQKNNLTFTPISISVEEGVTCITGANMGGKTISLKLLGLLAYLGQCGILVPAKSMEMGLNEYIFTSIGDEQSTDSGLSTFGAEIAQVVKALDKSKDPGLILIDELARGTNPIEGYAISLSIVHKLQSASAITVLTTHFDKVTDLEGVRHLQVIGLSDFDFDDESKQDVEDKLKILNKYMDYRLKEVPRSNDVPKDAIQIGKIMGLPQDVIEYAEKTLKNGW